MDQLGIIEANEEDWNENDENMAIMNNHKGDGIKSGKKDKENTNAMNKQ